MFRELKGNNYVYTTYFTKYLITNIKIFVHVYFKSIQKVSASRFLKSNVNVNKCNQKKQMFTEFFESTRIILKGNFKFSLYAPQNDMHLKNSSYFKK